LGNGHIQIASGIDVMVLAGSPNVPPVLEEVGLWFWAQAKSLVLEHLMWPL